jgi:hypothetical protein
VSTAAPAASTSHGPDDVDLAVQLALAGQLPEARRLLDRAAQAGKDEARIVAAGSPDRPLVGVAFSSSGDAFSVISEKGDEYRFELPSAALRVHAVPRVNGAAWTTWRWMTRRRSPPSPRARTLTRACCGTRCARGTRPICRCPRASG